MYSNRKTVVVVVVVVVGGGCHRRTQRSDGSLGERQLRNRRFLSASPLCVLALAQIA